ncbi:MAG: DUF1772 domain-containing protein [Ginsengibacter sp.]
MATQEYIMAVSNALLVLTTTCTALMAGLFYSYSYSVVPGFKLLNDTEYIAGMQSINKAIQSPVFFICFFGALLLWPVSTYLNYFQHPPLRFWLLLTATILYLTGVFGVTIFGNIPLNNTLEKFNLLNASKDTISLQRAIFEGRWNNLNLIRTISSILSLVLVIIACINSGKVI